MTPIQQLRADKIAAKEARDAARTVRPPLFRLNVRETIAFFDSGPLGSRGHMSAVSGVLGEDLGTAVFQDFAQRSGLGHIDVLPGSPTTGKKKGPRLDRWLLMTRPDGSQVLFQTEIKSWAAHAIGSRELSCDPDDNEYELYARERWGTQWNEASCIPSQHVVVKVLVEMARPLSVDVSIPIAPLVIFWYPIHPEGKREVFFHRELTGECPFHEGKLYIFSTSAHLRSLSEEFLDLPMPNAVPRINWLNRLGRPIESSVSSTP